MARTRLSRQHNQKDDGNWVNSQLLARVTRVAALLKPCRRLVSIYAQDRDQNNLRAKISRCSSQFISFLPATGALKATQEVCIVLKRCFGARRVAEKKNI